MGLRDTSRTLLEEEDAAPEDAEGGVAGNPGDEEQEPAPKWYNRALGRATAQVGRLRTENARLREILAAGEYPDATGTDAGWQLARKQAREIRDLRRERDALLAELHPHRVTAFLAERGLPETVRDLIGDRDPEEWWAASEALLARRHEGESPQ